MYKLVFWGDREEFEKQHPELKLHMIQRERKKKTLDKILNHSIMQTWG